MCDRKKLLCNPIASNCMYFIDIDENDDDDGDDDDPRLVASYCMDFINVDHDDLDDDDDDDDDDSGSKSFLFCLIYLIDSYSSKMKNEKQIH